MNKTLRILAVTAALCGLAQPPLARACGGEDYGPVSVNTHNPDLPLDRVTRGAIGIVPAGRAWHRVDRVVAWRVLTGVPLDGTEYEAWIRVLRAMHHGGPIDPEVVGVSPIEEGVDPDPNVWYAAREAAVGTRGPTIANGWNAGGAWVSNCLSDAFVTAAGVATARRAAYGANSDMLRQWVDGQDAVFSNCGERPGTTPAPLDSTAPEGARRDRAWQIAAAHFYAGRYADAERAFTAVAADTASPWSALARYLTVRTLTRAAQRDRDTPDAATLDRAQRALDALLADPAATRVHAMARAYQGWLSSMRDPAALAHAAGIALARHDDAFEQHLRDYDRAIDRRPDAAFARQPDDADRMTAWIAVLEGRPDGRTIALDNWRRTRLPVWLAAVLLSDGAARDPALTPALDAARAVRRDDPAYATVHYHRLRVLAARGEPVYDEAAALLASLTDDDGPSARGLVRALAASQAPDLARFLTHAHGPTAGMVSGSEMIVPPEGAEANHEAFTAVGARILGQRVPLAVLMRAAGASQLPAPLRAMVLRVAIARAAWLDDAAALTAASAQFDLLPDPERRAMRALTQAPTVDARHLELLRALLLGTNVTLELATPYLDADEPDDGTWDPSTNAPREGALQSARFLTAAERTALARERTRLTSNLDLRTWIANECARLAPQFRTDPAMPALLAAAVRNTRNNGEAPGAPVHAASRAAFTTLHRLYPRSPEARATRYWY